MRPWIARSRLGQRRVVRASAEALLSSLGGTSDEVAFHLVDAGIRGVPQDAFDCVLSRYLTAIIPVHAGVEEIAVGRLDAKNGPSQLILRLAAFPRWTLRIDLGEALDRFLVEFDAYRHEELIRPNHTCPRSSVMA